MATKNHEIAHQYQSTNNNCSQTALSMLLNYYGLNKSPKDIMSEIPVTKDEKGNDWGTITQQLASWCISLGFKVKMYSFDIQILDLSWKDLDETELLNKLHSILGVRDVPALGKEWSKEYVQSYIEFIKAGGSLTIKDYPTIELLEKLLAKAPIFASVNFNVMYGYGRRKNVGLRESIEDFKEGKLTNHSIVISGYKAGEFQVYDPWEKPGIHKINSERIIAAITAAQIEADNLLFQIENKNTILR